MITPDYVLMMARYNSWQNSQMAESMAALSADDLAAERGAFFGSILKTASHLLWGDLIWMSRFDGGAAPVGGITESLTLCADLAAWQALRGPTDKRIESWAAWLKVDDIAGDLTWYSGASGRNMTRPKAQLFVHMFNHQTHHRGQIHAMLTAAGQKPGATDIPFGPDLLGPN
jgi:uncharacterized damage-inducible protein DinB